MNSHKPSSPPSDQGDDALHIYNESVDRASREEHPGREFDKEWAEHLAVEEKAKYQRRQKLISALIACTALSALTVVLVQPGVGKLNPLELIAANWNFAAAFVSGLIATAILFSVMSSEKEVRFRDVDLRRRLEDEIAATERVRAAFTSLDLDHLRPKSPDENRVEKKPSADADPFRAHFQDMAKVVQSRAADAEEKASLLLDKGTAYSKWGIAFFIFSIIAWQVLGWGVGFKPEYLYGIVSCSAIFIFIEFLSGWFLRQYRHYVDTATYLLKVKSILDRYMLMHVCFEHLPADDRSRHRANKALVRMLEKEIEWPDTYLTKKQSVNFATEASGALKGLIKATRKAVKKEKKAPEKKDAEKKDPEKK